MPNKSNKDNKNHLRRIDWPQPNNSYLISTLFSISTEPDPGGFAGNDQSAGGWSAGRHRAPNQGNANAVCYEGELPAAGCFSC